MKFRKRMKKPIKKIDGLYYESVDWYRTRKSALSKVKQYQSQGFLAKAILEDWWSGWFVYINC